MSTTNTPAAGSQIMDAYKRMATEALYRPKAPSDGLGNISIPVEQLDLDMEAFDYACQWWQEEESHHFHVGCCHGPTRPATIFAIEAARVLCGGELWTEQAERLLRMALQDLEDHHRKRQAKEKRRTR